MIHQWGETLQRVYVDTDTASRELPWLVVIHGGAWRDPKIDYKAGLSCLEAAKHSRKFGGLCSIDYRLTPAVRHPDHVNDVIEGIRYILQTYKPNSIVLLGHSCGAFLAGQVYPVFAAKISRIICLEGIYNLQLLCEEYPEYESAFVTPAFGENRAVWPTVDWARVPRLKLVHSKSDELLSMQQPQWASNEAKVPIKIITGKHDEVFENFDRRILH